MADCVAGIAGVDFGAGAKSVSARVKPLVAGGSIQVRLDNVDGPVVATVPVDGAAGAWTTVQADVTGATGKHDVFFVFAAPKGAAADTDLVEVDNWAFTAAPAAVLDQEKKRVADFTATLVRLRDHLTRLG